MGGRAEGLTCADPGARTPIGASGILNFLATGWLVENFGLSEVHALPYWIKTELPGKHSGHYNILFLSSFTSRKDYPRIIKIRSGLAGKT
jgi:hypothetical protein